MTFLDFAGYRSRENTVGPGQYAVRSVIGDGPRISIKGRSKEPIPRYAPKYLSLPSTLSKKGVNLGTKEEWKDRKVSKEEAFPGFRVIPSSFGDVPKVCIRGQIKTKTEVTPGPGQYDPVKNDRGPMINVGVGKRFDFIKDNVIVPPGAYDIPSTIRPKTTISNSKGKQERRRPKFQKKEHPGPIYNVVRDPKADAKNIIFSKAPRDVPIPVTPGPGDYFRDDEDKMGRKDHRIMTTLHGRTSEPSKSALDVPFYDVPSTIKPSKKSMGYRPPTKYETISPGPAYLVSTTIAKKPLSIGIKPVIKDPRTDFPGPGTYFQSNAPKDISMDIVAPLDCAYKRDIIDYNDAKSLPGPADYYPQVFDPVKTQGFTIKKRYVEEKSSDYSPPYRNLPSSLSGPRYSIGQLVKY